VEASAVGVGRAALIAGPSTPSGAAAATAADSADPADPNHTRLVAAQARVARSTATLAAVQVTVAETAEIGAATLGTLEEQRESLLRTKGKAQDVNSAAGRGRTLLTAMHARAMANKAILWLVLLLLVASIVLVLYFGYIKSSPPSH
jgi:hypothetical protein